MFTPNTNSEVKAKFVGYLRDMYAIENRFGHTLESYGEQLAAFKEFPEFRERMYQCAAMCKEHTSHLLPRLKSYDVQPPVEPRVLKGEEKPISLSPYASPLVNYMAMVRPETPISFATTWHAFGQFKIASYRTLATLAQTFGDQEVVSLAEGHLRDEIETQRWLFEHLPEIALYTLQHEGIPVPQNAWEFAKQLEPIGTASTYPTFPVTPTK